MKTWLWLAGVWTLLAGLALPLHARSDEEWAERIAKLPTPANVGNAPAVVLFDETFTDVDDKGVASVTRRFALRILTMPGKEFATVRVPYLQNSDKVKTTKAWLLRNDKEVKRPEGIDWIDLSSDPVGALYSDYRYKQMSRRGDAAPGDVFAAETLVVGPLLTAQDSYEWGWGGLPVVNETYHIRIPSGFTLKAATHGESAPVGLETADHRETSWSLQDQPYIASEPMSPQHNPTQPQLIVQIEPPSTAAAFRPVVLKDWTQVAAWMNGITSAQCDVSPALSDKIRELTGNCPDAVSKIRSLGSYVQQLRYVALMEGLSKGLGYQPRKASQVFARGYGDCKDKANLLVSMLHEVGIEAFIAAARSGDDRAVWSDFASPGQFDHAIAAIRVDASVDLPSVVDTPQWGRMLFFDPTAEHTLVGDLPWYLQGTAVFVQTVGNDRLTILPRIEPQQGHAYVRKLSLKLNPDGSYSGQGSIVGRGQAGAELRQAMFAASTKEDLTKFATGLLGDSGRGAKLDHLSRVDDRATGVCGITFEVTKTNYLQFLSNSMVVVKSDLLSRTGIPALTAPTRRLPVKVQPVALEDDVEFILPKGMAPEEIPAPVTLKSAFGNYRREFKVDGGSIRLVRQLDLKQQILPPTDYDALKKFLSELNKAERASLLLKRGA